MNKKLYIFFIAVVSLFSLQSCIEDGFTTSPNDGITFSTDTLDMGRMFTLEPSPTSRFTVYNRNDKMINIGSISLRDDDDNLFRLNVDGQSGRSFSNIEIRPNDSIFVFVETTLPENGKASFIDVVSHLDFTTNGVRSTVVLKANGIDAIRCKNLTISSDAVWTPDKPYLIYDTLCVSQGATLTFLPGTKLYFHDKAAMKIEGSIISQGTPEKPVEMTGDRFGNVAADLPYELMSGQWGGLYFASSSTGNKLEYTDIRNSSDGLTFDSAQSEDYVAELINCRIRNSKNFIIDAYHTNLLLVGCELTDASNGILRLIGGKHTINHCTIANYYLFTALGGAAIQFFHLNDEDSEESDLPYLQADLSNTIIYGNGYDISHGDLSDTNIYLRRCLLKSAGEDDDHFISCLWDCDPLYYTIRNEYYFDYRLQPESPAIAASDPSIDLYGLTTDRYGTPLSSPADLGAYVFTNPD